MSGLEFWPALPAIAEVDPPVKLSDGRRLTARNRALLEAGIHPATRYPLAEGDSTCGDCRWHDAFRHHSGIDHKCSRHRLGESHSSASDIRVSWPACLLWEAR